MYSSLNVEKAYFMRGVRISKRVRFSHPLLIISVRKLEFTRLLALFVCEKTKSVMITERKSRSNILHV